VEHAAKEIERSLDEALDGHEAKAVPLKAVPTEQRIAGRRQVLSIEPIVLIPFRNECSAAALLFWPKFSIATP